MTHPASAPSFETSRLAAAYAAGCRGIRLAALRDAPAVFGTTCDTQAGLRLAAFVQRLDGAIAFGAYVGGALAGMAGFKRPDGAKGRHRGVPWGMSVAPAARRPGVGAARTVGQVALAAVDGRGAARAFCERHGFVAYGVEPRALDAANGCADALPMVKFPPLAPPRA
ncbi:GNAT family N-acetyltransferase [Burkholderia pseudomallei]|uniref:GNAT family N-acetyltransferase n=1 Tax=Burkholderia pseudomallei TaxID=28450 RepID=UPI00040E76AF|nr:GNAT family N-acetyltransferase [Burkholderia pseudomallei]AIP18276.1 acetyltransferase, gnat family [Burkholderia pseudomallei MSHR5855]AIP43585.1 acetyltransferase, gnat family [Burkholderia pseudomallei MSHR5848]